MLEDGETVSRHRRGVIQRENRRDPYARRFLSLIVLSSNHGNAFERQAYIWMREWRVRQTHDCAGGYIVTAFRPLLRESFRQVRDPARLDRIIWSRPGF
jgi:hypothetical protein